LENLRGLSAKSAKSGLRVDMGKAEGPECKSDWNFDYHGIILLKEILWTKSTGLWTDERVPVHGSTVDRASYPFGGSNLGHSIWIQRLRIEGRGSGDHRWRCHRRPTGTVLRCPKTHREEPRRGRGGW
jgi:hypothetical protein